MARKDGEKRSLSRRIRQIHVLVSDEEMALIDITSESMGGISRGDVARAALCGHVAPLAGAIRRDA